MAKPKAGEAVGEPVTILKTRGEDGWLQVQFEDGYIEWLSPEDVTIFNYRVKSQVQIEQVEQRKQERFEKQFGGEDRVAQIQAMSCAVCGALPPSQNAHTKSRGSGGDWQTIIPMCFRCHHESHLIGDISFQEKYKVDFEELVLQTRKKLGEI